MGNYLPSLVDRLLIVGILLGPLIWVVLAVQKRKQRTGGTEGSNVRKARIRLKPVIAGFTIMFTILSIIYLYIVVR